MYSYIIHVHMWVLTSHRSCIALKQLQCYRSSIASRKSSVLISISFVVPANGNGGKRKENIWNSSSRWYDLHLLNDKMKKEQKYVRVSRFREVERRRVEWCSSIITRYYLECFQTSLENIKNNIAKTNFLVFYNLDNCLPSYIVHTCILYHNT